MCLLAEGLVLLKASLVVAGSQHSAGTGTGSSPLHRSLQPHKRTGLALQAAGLCQTSRGRRRHCSSMGTAQATAFRSQSSQSRPSPWPQGLPALSRLAAAACSSCGACR